jgi:hypothetical protein
MCKTDPTWKDLTAGDPYPGYTLNSASKRDADRPRTASPIIVSEDEEIPHSQQQPSSILHQNFQPEGECTSQEEDIADVVQRQSGTASERTPPRQGVRRNAHGHDMDDPDEDFQTEDNLRRGRSADSKTVLSTPTKVTPAEKRKVASQETVLRRSERSLRSDAPGTSSPKPDGREPFKSPQVLTGTKEPVKKKAGPGRPAKKARNGKH